MYIWRFKVLSHIQVFVESEFVIIKMNCVLYPKYTVIQAIPVFVAFHKCVVLKKTGVLCYVCILAAKQSHTCIS